MRIFTGAEVQRLGLTPGMSLLQVGEVYPYKQGKMYTVVKSFWPGCVAFQYGEGPRLTGASGLWALPELDKPLNLEQYL